MKKQKIYALTVCMLGLIALAGSTLTFAGGGSSRPSIDFSNSEVREQYLQIVLEKGKYKFAQPELREKNILSKDEWNAIAIDIGVIPAEFNKIKNKHYTARKIVLGTLIYNHYKNTLADNAYSDEDRLLMLKQASDHGSESAIFDLLNAYNKGKLGLDINDPKVQKKRVLLAKKCIAKGSKYGTATLMNAYFSGISGID